jgi:hypothetical protein
MALNGYVIPPELSIIIEVYPPSVIRECYEIYIISTGETEYVTREQIETINITEL